MSADREFGIVVFGATGFVGKLVSRYLAEHSAGVRVALAGRSTSRLRALRDTLPAGPAREWSLLEVDAQDQSSVDSLARRTRVVLTLVGPYIRYGIPLASACAKAGTHYVDLTGEVFFVKFCHDELHTAAQRSGAKIVNSCGFDSVPSDILALLLHERAKADGAGELLDTQLVVTNIVGSASGGTIDSMRQQIIEMSKNPRLAAIRADPYCLSASRDAEPVRGDERDISLPMRIEGGLWTAPFIMGPYNSRVVRRSHSLLGYAYGRQFRYNEALAVGCGIAGLLGATIRSVLGAVFAVGMKHSFTRALLDKVLPKPGEGPSEEQQHAGSFAMRTTTTTATGRRYAATMKAQGDPGYSRTSVMISECALALALDSDLPQRAGVLTPATAIGSRLAERLSAQGFSISVESL